MWGAKLQGVHLQAPRPPLLIVPVPKCHQSWALEAYNEGVLRA